MTVASHNYSYLILVGKMCLLKNNNLSSSLHKNRHMLLFLCTNTTQLLRALEI